MFGKVKKSTQNAIDIDDEDDELKEFAVSVNIDKLLQNPKRQHIISCELSRDPRCYECPVFIYCGGDCHQLQWEDNQCGSARSLMINLKETINQLVA